MRFGFVNFHSKITPVGKINSVSVRGKVVKLGKKAGKNPILIFDKLQ